MSQGYDKEAEDTKRVEAEFRRSLVRARLPATHLNTVLPYPDTFPYKEKVANWTAGFIDALRSKETYGGLYLWGPSGHGKTFLAVSIGKWALSRGVTTQYVEFRHIFDAKMNPAAYDEVLLDGYTVWDSIMSAKVLIIDDVGRDAQTKYGKNNVVTMESVVEDRYAAGLITIITTTIPPDKLHTVSTKRFQDIVQTACWTLEIKGMDYRSYLNRKRGEL